jgi:hypothetical protein
VLGPRAVVAILVAPFAILGLDWSLREAPPACEDTDAWLAGLAPAAFATGCICLTVAVRISAFRRAGGAGVWTLAASAIWLALAASWWIGGRSSPVSLWALVASVLLLPGVPAALTLSAVVLVRPSWTLVAALAWLSAIVLVPGFVVVIESWGGVDLYC